MADYSNYKIDLGATDYPPSHDLFRLASEDVADEIEAARQNESSLLANLSNYIKNTLIDNIDGQSTGSNGYKCTDMKDGVNGTQDYCTVAQANRIASTTGASSIEDLTVGSLLPNDILVVNTAGDQITGRSTAYTLHTTQNIVANGNYDMNLSGPKTVTLPASPVVGTVISFADIGGNANNYTFTINPSSTPTAATFIMGYAESLTISEYQYCSFDLVYTGIASFGWTLARFQR